MRSRRIRRRAAQLDVTAFINLIVVLVPFLLSTAVFTRMAVIDMALPAASSAVDQLKLSTLELEVVVRRDALEVGDRVGGLIERIPNARGVNSGHDLAALGRLLQQLKAKYPDVTTATLRARPETSYDALIQLMDVLREVPAGTGAQTRPVPLFPDLSIGDAPTVNANP